MAASVRPVAPAKNESRAAGDEAPAAALPGRRATSGVLLPGSGVELSARSIIADYRLAVRSREASVIGRREVIGGRAKFGIFGDGKEVAQVALAKAVRRGDWRAGYYRDQTLMLATGMTTLRNIFAQLYASTEVSDDPFSAGRQMVNHYGTRMLDEAGRPRSAMEGPNSSSDVSPLATWMPRLLGLAYASKLYRADPALAAAAPGHTAGGNEVAFGTIGDSSTSEGLFWESLNAATVLQVPMLLSVWDDGYGISVPTDMQTVKGSISSALRGFEVTDDAPGLEIRTVAGWDYAALCDTYLSVIDGVRNNHAPALVHVLELTQPQGHSTSGSHERYKPTDRLAWERDHDCLTRMRAWIVDQRLATLDELDAWTREDRAHVEAERAAAWEDRLAPLRAERDAIVQLVRAAAEESGDPRVAATADQIMSAPELNRRTVDSLATRAVWALRGREGQHARLLAQAVDAYHVTNSGYYSSHLLSSSVESPLRVPAEAVRYADSPEMVDGRLVLRSCFDENLTRDRRIAVWGEDVGALGDVNLVFENLQGRHGRLRVTDTGIREASIVGQAVGAALRGLRPVADIQYLDYLLYGLQIASDDLATLRWRTAGGQQAPVVIRTKGHRLQGIWHAGSPLGTVVNALRGVHVAVPRDCTRAAGLYNTLLRGDDPGLVIEVLNAYRLKEAMPANVGTFTIPLGRPETLRGGTDVTVVTYGACCRIAMDAAGLLGEMGVDTEVIDVQTLLPFDIGHDIAASVARTGAVLFLDEDVPGGASAYMMQNVLEGQSAWWSLDAAPRTLTATATRPAYAADGEYYCKPGVEDVVRAVYDLARDRDPRRLPRLL